MEWLSLFIILVTSLLNATMEYNYHYLFGTWSNNRSNNQTFVIVCWPCLNHFAIYSLSSQWEKAAVHCLNCLNEDHEASHLGRRHDHKVVHDDPLPWSGCCTYCCTLIVCVHIFILPIIFYFSLILIVLWLQLQLNKKEEEKKGKNHGQTETKWTIAKACRMIKLLNVYCWINTIQPLCRFVHIITQQNTTKKSRKV